MTLMPEVHDALARGVATRGAAHRRRWRAPRRRMTLLLLGAVLLSGSAVAAVVQGWHPTLGNDRHGHPTTSTVALSARSLTSLAVLRRPQDARDRGGDVQAVLRQLGAKEIGGIHVPSIRVVQRERDRVVFVLAADHVGRRVAGSTVSVKRRVLCVFTGLRVPARTVTLPVKGKLTRVRLPPDFTTGQSCGSLATLGAAGIGLLNGAEGRLVAGALVPDAVARVSIRLRDGRTVSAPVRDNYYSVDVGKNHPVARDVRWYDAAGRLIVRRR
jgi:hypothetical protein